MSFIILYYICGIIYIDKYNTFICGFITPLLRAVHIVQTLVFIKWLVMLCEWTIQRGQRPFRGMYSPCNVHSHDHCGEVVFIYMVLLYIYLYKHSYTRFVVFLCLLTYHVECVTIST